MTCGNSFRPHGDEGTRISHQRFSPCGRSQRWQVPHLDCDERHNHGDHCGKTLRQHLENHPLIIPTGIVDSVQSLPYQGLVILSGQVLEPERKLLHSVGRLLPLNPAFFSQDVGITSAQVAGLLFGEFSQSANIQAWQSVDQVNTLEGVGDFIAFLREFVINSGTVSINQFSALRTLQGSSSQDDESFVISKPDQR